MGQQSDQHGPRLEIFLLRTAPYQSFDNGRQGGSTHDCKLYSGGKLLGDTPNIDSVLDSYEEQEL